MASTYLPNEMLVKILKQAFVDTEEEGGADWFYKLREINQWFRYVVDDITTQTNDKGVQRGLCNHNVPQAYMLERARHFTATDRHDYKAIHREWNLMQRLTREDVREVSHVAFGNTPAFEYTAFVMNGANTAFLCGTDGFVRWAVFWPTRTSLHHMPLQYGGPTLCLRGVATIPKRDLVVRGLAIDFDVLVVAQSTTLSAYKFIIEDHEVKMASIYTNCINFPPTASRKLYMSAYR